MYKIVFRLDQFLDFKLTYFPTYSHFCDFNPFLVICWPLSAILLSLKLNIKIWEILSCFKCFLKCLYQLVFSFYYFLDFKLTYFSLYYYFCEFDSVLGHLLPSNIFLHSLRLNINILENNRFLQMFIKMFVPNCFLV